MPIIKGRIILGEITREAAFLVGNYPGGNYPGIQLSRGQLFWGQFSGGQLSWGAIVLGEIVWEAIFHGTIVLLLLQIR